MRQMKIALLLVSGLCLAHPLSAQQSVSSVSSVRLVFQKVDQVALDFGVDTSAMRHRAVQRLSAAGIAVVPSPQPRSRTSSPLVIPSAATSAVPLSRMVSAIWVKSPFSHNALFGFVLFAIWVESPFSNNASFGFILFAFSVDKL